MTYLEGKHKHYRHVYVTLSTSVVNCKQCYMALGIRDLAKVKL